MKGIGQCVLLIAVGFASGIVSGALLFSPRGYSRPVEREVEALRKVFAAVTTGKPSSQGSKDGALQLLKMLREWHRDWSKPNIIDSRSISGQLSDLAQFDTIRSVGLVYPVDEAGLLWEDFSTLARVYSETLNYCEQLAQTGEVEKSKNIVRGLYRQAALLIDSSDQGSRFWVGGVFAHLPRIRKFWKQHSTGGSELPPIRFEPLYYALAHFAKSMPVYVNLVILCSDSVPAWAYDAAFANLEEVLRLKSTSQEEIDLIRRVVPIAVNKGRDALKAVASRYSRCFPDLVNR